MSPGSLEIDNCIEDGLVVSIDIWVLVGVAVTTIATADAPAVGVEADGPE